MLEKSGPDWAGFCRNAESALRARLINAESARIDWPHGFLLGSWKPFMSKRMDGYWTCGLVNARNRMGGYLGSRAFVGVLDPKGKISTPTSGSRRNSTCLLRDATTP